MESSMLGKVLILTSTFLLTAEGAPVTKCFISKYRDLPPSEIKAIKLLKDTYESYERLIVLKHKVDLAVEILANMTNSSLSKNVIKPLEDLQIIENDLKICISNHRTQHSHQFKHWLHHFNKTKKMESPECLQKVVIPRIFQLRQEVVCVAQDKICEKKRSRLSSPSMN
ncbi:interferon lambda-2-like [Microcaecilia unicolor]|uniref:Interferon lambda-2-like n=1 Tax=Microcaecilia unicolor TaxID=1415580 RepID=A0A6P7X2X1_9AMPH|nr:interferon lambda-2-like [Microcaecilia unicolor]